MKFTEITHIIYKIFREDPITGCHLLVMPTNCYLYQVCIFAIVKGFVNFSRIGILLRQTNILYYIIILFTLLKF